jgi:hypothetical protein
MVGGQREFLVLPMLVFGAVAGRWLEAVGGRFDRFVAGIAIEGISSLGDMGFEEMDLDVTVLMLGRPTWPGALLGSAGAGGVGMLVSPIFCLCIGCASGMFGCRVLLVE